MSYDYANDPRPLGIRPFSWEVEDFDKSEEELLEAQKKAMVLGSFWKETIEVLIQQVKDLKQQVQDLKAALAKASEAI